MAVDTLSMHMTITVAGWKTTWLHAVGLALMGALLAVWPVAGSITLRDLLLLLNLSLFGGLVWLTHPAIAWRGLRWPLGLYLALTAWLVVVALFVSDETAWSLGEIRGQWLKALLAMIAGALAALAVRDTVWMRRAVIVVVTVLLAHVVLVDFDGARMLLKHGEMIKRLGGITSGVDAANYLTNILLILLLAETFIRLIGRKRFLPLPTAALAVLFLLALFSIHVEGVRNGIVEVLLVLLVFAVLFAVEHRRRVGKTTVLAVALLLVAVPATFAYLSHKTDTRWRTFMETVPLALDTDTHRQWISLDRKDELKLSGGEPVDWSNYMRLARIKVGLELTLENPLGVGFGRNAFGHAVRKKYGENSSHSHSGLIDIAVGTGIPGALLWLGFLASLAALGWRHFRRTHDYCALALFLLVTGYGTRMVLDSIIRDHMLQMFLFLAAFLTAAAVGKPDDEAASAAPRPA